MWSLSVVAPACEPFDWASLLEEAEARVAEERCRGDVAELRCEGLRRVERDACSRAHSLERQLDTCRLKLKEAVAEAKESRPPVHSAPKIASRVTKALERRVESQDAEIADLRLTLRRSDERRERIEERHQHEIAWLKKDIDRGRLQTVKVSREGGRVAARTQ